MVGAARQAGYNLVALMVIVAVVNIGIAASLPLWSKVIQRDKEGELIHRGLQYAEAIRVFQERNGRFPTTLEELIEIEPRSIRQLWLDPMNDEPEWGLVLSQAGRQLTPGQQGNVDPDSGLGSRRSRREERRARRERDREGRDARNSQEDISPRQRIESRGGDRRGVPRAGQQVTRGPIIGVHSLVEEEGIRTFEGGSKYSEWKFTVELLPQFGLEDGGEYVPRLHSNWIGRAFPEGAEPEAGGMPDSPLDRDRKKRNDRRSNQNRFGRDEG